MKNKLLFSAALITGIFVGTIAQAADTTNSQFSADQVKQIQQITHDYLVKNPQVLIEASQALQQQQLKQMQKTAAVAISKNAKDIFNNPDSPVIGNAKGNVTLVEFMDYQCAHCKEMGPVITDLINDDKNLRVVIKQLPIFGKTSEYAAKAALAAQKQDKFKEFHEALLKDENPLSQDEVLKIAKSVGLDTQKLQTAINSGDYDQQIKDNYSLAKALALMGTPALIVSDRSGNKTVFIPGTATKENLQTLISQAQK